MMARQWRSRETRTGASTIEGTADLGIQLAKTEPHAAYRMQTRNSKDIYLGAGSRALRLDKIANKENMHGE